MREMKRSKALLICLAAALGVGALVWLCALLGGRDSGVAPQSTAPSAPAVEVTPGPSQAPSASPDPASVTVQPASAAPDADQTQPPETVAPTDAQPSADPSEARLTAGPDYDYAQPVPESEPVEDAYFADAVFIGDSRTDGFRLFSGLTQGDYLVKTGLSAFKVETDQVTVDNEKMTVPQALARKTYGKVYVCLGLNELGMYDDQGYYDHYAALIDIIRAAQPSATVYVQLLIPVNVQKCGEKGIADYINNEQIAVYNGLLRQLAQEKRVFLTDPAQVIVDETGQPPYDAVADGVHFQKGPYQQWLDYLKRHTIRENEEEFAWEESKQP